MEREQTVSYSNKLKCLLECVGKSRGHSSNITVETLKRNEDGATYRITNHNPLNCNSVPKPYTMETYYEDCVIDSLYVMLLSIL